MCFSYFSFRNTFCVSMGKTLWKSQNVSLNGFLQGKHHLVPAVLWTHAAKQALWLQSFVDEMRGPQDQPIMINCDNQGAIVLAKDKKYHSCTKHINLGYHFIHEAVKNGKFLVTYIPTDKTYPIFSQRHLQGRNSKFSS